MCDSCVIAIPFNPDRTACLTHSSGSVRSADPSPGARYLAGKPRSILSVDHNTESTNSLFIPGNRTIVGSDRVELFANLGGSLPRSRRYLQRAALQRQDMKCLTVQKSSDFSIQGCRALP